MVIALAAIMVDIGVILAWRRIRRQRDRPHEPSREPAPQPACESAAESLLAVEPPAPPAVPPPLPAPLPGLRQVVGWGAAHWREMAVALALAGLLVCALALTPRDVIPTFGSEPVKYPPLAGLFRIRLFLDRHTLTWLMLCPLAGTVALAGVLLVGWRAGRWQQALRGGALLGLISLALEGQLLLLDENLPLGLGAYGLALLGFGAWLVACRPPLEPEPASARRPMTWPEMGLLIAVLALAAFARFYALPRVPYGIEGDESKWTVEVVSVMLDGRHSLYSEYHYLTEPVSFYMQAPFHRLLGPSVQSARLAVATYSLLATLAFYWLVRGTLGPSVALLSTFLLSISLVDVSASRLALVEAHVKLWAILGLAFLAHGLRVRRPIHSFLGGLALSLGLLTYDTVVPVVAVAVVWAIVSLVARRAPAREWAIHLTALLIPILVVSPFVAEYLMGRMSYYDPGRQGWQSAPLRTFWGNLSDVVRNFWQQTYGDFLIVRPGPIVNGLLVPFLALGFLLALGRIRRPRYALPVLWAVLLFLPVPIWAGAPYVRVFYPGFPALYVLIALALLFVWRELTAALPGSVRPALLALAGLALAGLVVSNLYLYFNELEDPVDRRMRRELADTVVRAVAPDRRVYVPYFVESGDAVEHEQELFLLEARRKLAGAQVDRYVWTGIYEELLPTLSQEGAYFESVAFVVNHSVYERARDLSAIEDTLVRCLGARPEHQGWWFSLYVADGFDVEAARCVAPRVHVEGPFPTAPQPGQPVELRWRMGDAAGPGEALLECQQLWSNTVVVEAEDIAEAPGWEKSRRLVEGFRGRGYLADLVTLGSASGDIVVPETSSYALWVRTYCREEEVYLLHLSVDGQPYAFPPCATGLLHEWMWSRLGVLSLGAGTHTLRMARPIQDPDPDTLALFVDTILLSADPAFDPAAQSEWLPLVQTREEVSPHVSSGAFQFDVESPGHYRCWITLTDGERLVDWNGEVGARSNAVEFTVYSGD